MRAGDDQRAADNRLALDVPRDRLRNQVAFTDAIEAKVSILFAAGSTLVGLLAAVLALAPSLSQASSAVMIAVAVVCYALLTVVWWRGGGPGEWSIGPNVGDVLESIQEEPERLVVDRLVASYRQHYKDNECDKEFRSKMMRSAFALVVVETACLACAAFLVVLA